MASIDTCRIKVDELAAKWSDVDAGAGKKNIPDRTLELTLLDLDVSFRGRLQEGELIDIVEGRDSTKPNVRLVMSSDDLVAMADGEMKFAHAWAAGRVRLDASLRDLMRLRSMMRRSQKKS